MSSKKNPPQKGVIGGSIPLIIHQIWIGPKPPPTKFMDTWRDKHPNFEYIRWTEAEIKKRGLPLSCANRIDEMEEMAGKADIIRWEILYHYGGVFLDADSICIEPIDSLLENVTSFVGWENEQCRAGLAAVGTMAFTPKHPLVRECIEWIQQNDCSVQRTGKRAWMLTGPVLLTNMLNTKKYPDVTIYPSYYFLPEHFTGLEYNGHGRVFEFQEWGSTKSNYDTMNSIVLNPKYLPPKESVSILVSSYNTDIKYVNACLESIKHQNGHFHMELVWINDGSDVNHTNELKTALNAFERTTRFTTVVYKENDSNKGLGYTLNYGVRLCSHEIIIKMDSDDIMTGNRIQKQLQYMKENPEVKICGSQINMFRNENEVVSVTKHPSLTWTEFKKKPNHWFMNHPSVCYRKSAVLEVGNYNVEFKKKAEDFELELRMLKKYGYIHNMEEALVHYRLHDTQATHKGGEGGIQYWSGVLDELIKKMMA